MGHQIVMALAQCQIDPREAVLVSRVNHLIVAGAVSQDCLEGCHIARESGKMEVGPPVLVLFFHRVVALSGQQGFHDVQISMLDGQVERVGPRLRLDLEIQYFSAVLC